MLLKMTDLKDIIKKLPWIAPLLLVLMMGCNHSSANDEVTGRKNCPANCKCQTKDGRVIASEEKEGFGIDVSHHNGDIDWAKLKDAEDLLFVYVKATEGATHMDRNFKANAKGAAEAGYLTGSYHFFRMTSSAHTQNTQWNVDITII